MFTGLIQQCGEIRRRGPLTLEIAVKRLWRELVYGESIAVNGACLTLERVSGDIMIFHTLAETLVRTNLGTLPIGAAVNLERAMRLGDAVGGHLVSGHIDATGLIRRWTERPGGDLELTVSLPEILRNLVAAKGSIAIDGVSLTVVAVRSDEFTVELIPVTRADTALKARAVGSAVNLEGDLLARYVARQFECLAQAGAPAGEPASSITMQTLYNAGFVK